MKFSESWLRTLVNPSLTSEALAHLLTMAGLEVEEMSEVAPPFDKVVVAQVLSKEKHPDADRLNILSVDVGQAEPLAIVCGAQNVTVGMKAPCALVGAKLPKIEIKAAKVRGIASFGMMCSAVELGLAEESSGLLELAADAIVGKSIREHLDLDDHLITLKLTPNRSDCLSLQGIAREVSALTGTVMEGVTPPVFAEMSLLTRKVSVSAVAACPRYTGRVISGVNAKANTPAWMVQRLERCGLRGISALVDVTNYVLLELGQPLHAFDFKRLNGDIQVRFASSGEQIKLLNEQTIDLQNDMLVVADNQGPVALAGVMGGANSAVDDSTTDIFLESAYFAPAVIVGKTRRLGFGSDSAYRFERGVDFAATQIALNRATQLILDICGGQAGAVTEVLNELPLRQAVKLRIPRVERVLGVTLPENEITQILVRLGMKLQQQAAEYLVTPPSYRFDIAIEEDLIEEIARVHGYENIHPVPPQAAMTMLPLVEAMRPLAKLRQAMVLRDYQEVINYAFVETELENDLYGNIQAVKLQNPIASQMAVMRSSLLGGLLTTLRTNLARKQSRVRVFEIGACFSRDTQTERLAGLCYGSQFSEQWGVGARSVDFYDIKSDIEAIFTPSIISFSANIHPASHPGRSAQILMNGQVIGWLGELHPSWLQKFDIPQAAVWFEVELATLTAVGMPIAADVSKLPPVRRDLAVVVNEEVAVQNLLQAMQQAKAPYVIEVGLFDVYRGKGVDEGKKSLAFRVLLQDTQKTLTDIEIDKSIAQLVAILQQHDAQMRI
ncbi:MAG: phenylalanine--tRNA ligase subunit beta [Gallionellaceae bacterium]|jgi:phenylalanyl-tRNA synthetase beta chain